jgi:4,5-dihydroxyphthalate decarboxylase
MRGDDPEGNREDGARGQGDGPGDEIGAARGRRRRAQGGEDVKLKALLGDYPNTKAIKSGAVRAGGIELNFADEKTPNRAFRRVVRDLEFDVAELAIATYLVAKAHAKPLALLPIVIRGKFAHDTIAYNAGRGTLSPKDLEGRRVGIRAYAQTTPVWIRGILANDYGVDLGRVKWVTFEDSHVAEFRDPASCERAPADRKLRQMLLDGELDAAVLSIQRDAPDPRLKTLIPDTGAAAKAWYAKYGLVPINHMVVVKESLLRSHPDAVREVFRALAESKRAAGLPREGAIDTFPVGVEPNRRSLEKVIQYAVQQGLLPRPFTVDELFGDVTRALGR